MLPYGQVAPPGVMPAAAALMLAMLYGMFMLGTIDDVMLLAPLDAVKHIGCDVTTGGSGLTDEFSPQGKLLAPSGLGILVSHVG